MSSFNSEHDSITSQPRAISALSLEFEIKPHQKLNREKDSDIPPSSTSCSKDMPRPAALDANQAPPPAIELVLKLLVDLQYINVIARVATPHNPPRIGNVRLSYHPPYSAFLLMVAE